MGVTISTHNGSAVAREHNVRNYKVVSKEPHIDLNGLHETWIDEPVRQSYERLFGEAVAEYNAKQSRPERRISSYYNDICKDKKKHPVYEMIIGIYGKNEDGTSICSAEQGKEIMREFVDTWKRRNPNLALIGAYYHADEEGEPHVHLDYIPVAHGYSRGLQTQTGLVKALEEQGITKTGKETAQILWEKQENDYLTALCESAGLTVNHPRAEGRMHLDTQTLKLKTRAEQLEQTVSSYDRQIRQIEDKTAVATTQLADINSQITEKTAELQNLSNLKTNISGMYNEIDRFKADKKSVPFSKPKRVSVDEKQLDDIIELAKQGLSERTKNYQLVSKMQDMIPKDAHKRELKERDDEISSLKEQLNTWDSAYNRVKQAVQNLHLGSQVNEELRRMQREEQEQSRSSEREQQTQQKKKSSPKR